MVWEKLKYFYNVLYFPPELGGEKYEGKSENT